MSDLRIPNLLDDIARLRLDVDDLLRRVPTEPVEQAIDSCCLAYCCLDTDGHTATTGQIVNTCVFDIDPIGGAGLRLELDGWVRVRASAAGAFSIVAWSEIDGTAYDGAPRVDLATVASGDTFTFPLGGTYDVAQPDPSLTIRFQNLSTVTWSIVQVYARLRVGPREGSVSCGHPHSGTGPL